MAEQGENGAIVTLLCDSGERYRSTLFDDSWLAARGVDIKQAEEVIERFFDTGRFEGTKSRIHF
jgi:cysteine synthase A